MSPGEFILIPFAGGLLLFGGIAYTAWKRDRVRPVHQCPRCGYDLKNKRRDGCPECGWNTKEPVKRL